MKTLLRSQLMNNYTSGGKFFYTFMVICLLNLLCACEEFEGTRSVNLSREQWMPRVRPLFERAALRANTFRDPAVGGSHFIERDSHLQFDGQRLILDIQEVVAEGRRFNINNMNASRFQMDAIGGRIKLTINFESEETEIKGNPDVEINNAVLVVYLTPEAEAGHFSYRSVQADLTADYCAYVFGCLPVPDHYKVQIEENFETTVQNILQTAAVKSVISTAIDRELRSAGFYSGNLTGVLIGGSGEMTLLHR